VDSARASELRRQLHRVGLERDRLRSALARATGLALADLDALEHLEAGPLTQRELGDRLLLTSGGTTVLVDRLERGGWVHRRPHPDDRRSVLVELSDRARTQQPDALARYHAAVDAAARAVPREHRAALIAFLDRVAGEARDGATRLTRGATAD
jgi:DNA-binding MarR family transcriptional regulator